LPHLWLKLSMVKPEIMLYEMVLNLSTLLHVIAQYPVSWQLATKWISTLLIKQSGSGAHVFVHALKLKADTLKI